MRKTIEVPNVTWVDIQNPTREDINFLKEKFNFHPLVLEELIPPILRTKVEVFPTYLFLVIHYPSYDKNTRETRPKELDIVVTRDAVVTSHYYSISPLKYLFDKCNLYPESRQNYMGQGAGFLLFHMLNEFWENAILKLSRINKKLDQIEQAIFKGQQAEMLREISFTKADITDFLRIVIPQGEIFESLRKEGTKFFGQELDPYLSHLTAHWSEVKNDLISYKETIQALEDTNNSLLAYRTNQIVKVLTLFSVIVLPTMVVANIFGQNLEHPFVDNPYNFWIVLAIMVLGTAGVIAFFRKKGWM